MDLHRVLIKRNQKANMSPYAPQTYGEYFPTMPQFEGKGAPFHPLSQSCGNIPFKGFTYSNHLNNFKFPHEKMINKAMDSTRGIQKLENLPAMSLTCIVGGLFDSKQCWNTQQNVNCFGNPLDMINDIVNKSMEITRTMSCPDPFNFTNIIPTKMSPSRESAPPVITPTDDTTSTTKLSYADVTKMNLSNFNKNNSGTCKPTVNTNNLSSLKTNTAPCIRKDTKVISPPQPYKTANRHNAKSNRIGTNHFTRIEKDSAKPKFQSVQRNINSRKPLNKRGHSSLKRELGTKKNNQKMDFDGSIWGHDNSETDVYEDCIACSLTPPPPSVLMRVRSISSDSDCSSEVSECLRNPRVRSLSECSINSVDSEDSFIIFDDCTDDRDEESYEENTSSDEENDEYESVTRSCDGETQADFLQCVNSKWDTLPNKSVSTESQANKTSSSLSPCQALKQVRFACGEAFAKVRKLCVWDFAHRAARIGPWEQAARDRDRFAKRISLLAPIINPVLDSKHRNKIYNLYFAPR